MGKTTLALTKATIKDLKKQIKRERQALLFLSKAKRLRTQGSK